MSLIFRHTHPPATELAALERQKYNCIMLDEFNLKWNQPETVELTSLEHHKTSAYTYNGRSIMTTLAPSFLNLAGNKDFHKSLNELDFSPHPSTS